MAAQKRPPRNPPPSPEGFSGNPSAHGMNVTVSIPETIDIRLVNASALNDFEVWTYIASVVSNFMVGFWVWHGQSTDVEELKVLSFVSWFCTFLFIASLGMVIFKRVQLSRKTKKITLQNTLPLR